MALRNLISTAIGAGAGLTARELLELYQGRITIGYGILHLLTFALLAASYVVFAMIRETNLPARPSRQTPTLGSNLRALPGLIANRPQYRRYLLDRLLAGGGFIMAAWRGIHVTAVLGVGDAYVGNLVIVGVAGGFVGNFLAGPMGDRFGGKAALLIGRALMVAVAVWMPLARTQWEFLALFAAIGLAKTFAMVGQQTLTLEIVPLVKRATYLGLIAAVGMVGSIAGSQISRLTWQLTGGSFHWVSWLTLACSIGSVILLLRIDEPRGRSDAEALQA
jgi:predicted MFS family arabinose efflux permease